MSESDHPQDFGFAPRSAAFRANPYPVYHKLYTYAPLHYRTAHNDWLLTRYVDVTQVLKSADFGRADKLPQTEVVLENKLLQRRVASQRLMRLWFLLQNPPVHSRLRGVLSDLYTRKYIKKN